MSPDQRDNLAVLMVGGATEGPDCWLARRRMEFGRDLAVLGQVGEDIPTDEMIAAAVRIPGDRRLMAAIREVKADE